MCDANNVLNYDAIDNDNMFSYGAMSCVNHLNSGLYLELQVIHELMNTSSLIYATITAILLKRDYIADYESFEPLLVFRINV